MIHFDTNAAIALLKQAGPSMRARFDAARAASSPMALSIIVFHELMYGAAASQRRKQNEEGVAFFITSSGLSVLPFTEPDAGEAADIRAHLRGIGKPIGPYDVLIAAQARRAGATLVTANQSEFERVPGLIVVNWDI